MSVYKGVFNDCLLMNLKGKRILFICVKLFGIEQQIKKELELAGATVDYYDERPANNFMVKALIRINRNLLGKFINRYHQSIIEQTKSVKYDYIFFIKGEAFSEKNLKNLFEAHPEAPTIIYHWDSIANNNNAKRLLNYFDYKFSFDRRDCEAFGMQFLPLFYYREYKEIAQRTDEMQYDMLFVGTAHSDRYRLVSAIKQQISAIGRSSFTFFFFQGKIMFYKYKLTHPEMKAVPMSDVSFTPLSKQEILDLYAKSRIVVDIQHPKQTGLTLRTLETLGSNRKLITTNTDIATYDFYNPCNILIVDRDNPIIPKNFLDSPYQPVPPHIYDKYSITTWVKEIFK